MTQLDFDFAEVNDDVGNAIANAVCWKAQINGVVDADDCENINIGNRSRAIIGGVFNGLCRAGILRVLPERVTSRIERNHRRKINQYALAS
jgi:hypothetical protein